MSRALLILDGPRSKSIAHGWIEKAPTHTRVTFQGPKRSMPQNDKMWAMLTEIARQHRHDGQRLTADDYKVLFMHALNGEGRMVRAIDGVGWVNLGRSSSDLSKEDFGDLLELISEWSVRNGIVLHDEEEAAA